MPQGKNGTKNSKVQKRKKGSEQKLPDKEKTDTPANSNCVEPNLDQEQTERKTSGTSEKGTQSEPYSSGNEQSKNAKRRKKGNTLSILCRILREKRRQRIALIVFGDIGRSPRMQYHALSLANHGFSVSVVAFQDTTPKKEILEHEKIRLISLPSFPSYPEEGPMAGYYIYMIFKVIFQIFSLFYVLAFMIKPTKYFMVQNPPSIPTLAVVKLICFFRKSKMIIDWHNYGYSILAMRLGKNSFLVNIAEVYEKFIGKMADYNIAVTKAMADDLQRNWGLRGKIIVLCDKPPKEFHRLSQDESKLFWRTFFLSEAAANIPKKFSSFMSKQTESNGNSVMKFTGKNDNKTAILVSSTSWTKDEDFDILLDALKQYDLAVTNTGNDSSYPNILVIITGKGPGKELFKKKVSLTELNKVHITTAWLPAEDYPKLLGCSDLGVSLHTSSSGLDLPMKVVDMFGCGLPVLAYNFDCLNELVVDGKNGYVFRDCEDLCSKLMFVLKDFEKNTDALDKLRDGIDEFNQLSWDMNWDYSLLPIFTK